MKLLHYFLIGSVPLTDLSTWEYTPERVNAAKLTEPILPKLTCLEVLLTEELLVETVDAYDQSFA